ncbi:MAG: hypothetical protein ABIP35_13190 [Ginsengibacter sp.]
MTEILNISDFDLERPKKGIWNIEHSEYLKIIQAKLKLKFQLARLNNKKRNRCLYESEKQIGLYFLYSKIKVVGLNKECYYTLRQYQIDNLKTYQKKYFAFGVGSINTIVLIPEFDLFKSIDRIKKYDSNEKTNRWNFHFIHNAIYPEIKETKLQLKEYLIAAK